MCGIVGLHLRNPELHPQLGELLTGMLCEMGERGSDSAGVAVYGDPTWAPPGQGCVSIAELPAGAGA
ncbi:MAG: glutamine amidotransferase, partial [Actinomycetota bacterium]|nr:glutamine amidotransferase [Actinomycetota bacterium]